MITPIGLNFYSKVYKTDNNSNNSVLTTLNSDYVAFGNKNVDITPLVLKKIAPLNVDTDTFLEDFCAKTFPSDIKDEILPLLKNGDITFSSSIYTDAKNPKSALAVELDPNKKTALNIISLDEFISKGQGVGINFSKFQNPKEEILALNSYFKYKENKVNRPPAGIALLNINHPKILEFISLKDEADYKDWCFDLSVVIDSEFMNCLRKNVNYTLNNGTAVSPSMIYQKLLSSMLKKGEPGVIFSDDKNYISDSCAAAKLSCGEGLTIGQINLSTHFDSISNSIDIEKLKRSANILKKVLQKLDSKAYIGVLGYQELLDKLHLQYGSDEANLVLDKVFQVLEKANVPLAISPTGTTNRMLKVTPSIEPKERKNLDYFKEINTMAIAQKHISNTGNGQISKTIVLKKNSTTDDVDKIIKHAKNQGLKGICVFPSDK